MIRSLCTALIAAVVAGCSSGSGATASNNQDLTHPQVTGQSGSPTINDWQSETATSIQTFSCAGCSPIVTVTYNDDTNEPGNYITYTQTDRFVYSGASRMGWSVSTNGGGSFNYGGKIPVPAGWAVLWGDPALTSSRSNQNYAYISNIAVPSSKFPSVGYIQGAIDAYIGGACISRSIDAGRTFNPIAPTDCVTKNNDFYDGGSMETDTSNGVYAAFVDYNTSSIDVWHAGTLTGSFVLMSNPFPGIQLTNHPRLVFEPVWQRLYVLAQGNPSYNSDPDVLAALWMTYYGGPWDPPGWAPPTMVATDCLQNPLVTLPAGRQIRGGPQYNFATAQASINGDDGIRVAYTTKTGPKPRVIHTLRCAWPPPGGPVTCMLTPEWSGDAYGGLQWNPIVRAQYGFGVIPVDFMISYTTTNWDEIPNGVGWAYGNLAVGGGGIRSYIENIAYTNYLACPDLRGYWGDYDDMQPLTPGNPQTTFLRLHTDASWGGCNIRYQYVAWTQHVSAITFP